MRMKTRRQRRRGKGSPAVVSLSHLFPLLGRASKDNCVSSSYALACTSRVCPMTLNKLDVISTRSRRYLRQNSANDKCRSNGRNPRFSFLYLSPSPPVDRERSAFASLSLSFSFPNSLRLLFLLLVFLASCPFILLFRSSPLSSLPVSVFFSAPYATEC